MLTGVLLIHLLYLGKQLVLDSSCPVVHAFLCATVLATRHDLSQPAKRRKRCRAWVSSHSLTSKRVARHLSKPDLRTKACFKQWIHHKTVRENMSRHLPIPCRSCANKNVHESRNQVDAFFRKPQIVWLPECYKES